MMTQNTMLAFRKNNSCRRFTARRVALVLTQLALCASAFFTCAAHAVVNGFALPISHAPASVAVVLREVVERDGDLAGALWCGGTVISPRWVITAAHCYDPQSAADEYMVVVGSNDLEQPVNQPIEVRQLIFHENYRDLDLERGYDIALIQLATDVNVPPIPLDATPVETGDIGMIVGWGSITTFFNPTFSPRVRAARMTMNPGELCREFRFTDSRFICARPRAGSGGPCLGDSGGALYRVGRNNTIATTMVGITSFVDINEDCRGISEPSGYTSIAAYAGWIRDKTGIQALAPDEDSRSGIRLVGSGWWQIQRVYDYEEVYQGPSRDVLLPAAVYQVVNLTNGLKDEHVVVNPYGIILVGTNGSDTRKGINLTGEGWWQVQDSETYVEFYQGRSKFVTLPLGTYNITNLTTGYRKKNFVVR